jgi:hypothetical protein
MLLPLIQRIRQSNGVGKILGVLGICLILLLAGCSLPQVSAESRLFLNLSLDFVSDFALPQTEFKGTTVGGFSALTYDRQRDRLYALVNDKAQPRFYTLRLNLHPTASTTDLVSLEDMTLLSDPLKTEISPANLEGEGIALTSQGSLFIASAGDEHTKVPPRLSEFQQTSGQWQQNLPLPKQYWTLQEDGTLKFGAGPSHGLGALAISPEGDRLFAATAGPLIQDIPPSAIRETLRFSRLLHYWIGEPEPVLIAEHLYPLAATADRTENNLSDIIPLDNAGHFLSLEQHYSPATGYSAMIYQIATGVATDTSRIQSLAASATRPAPIMKKLLLDLSDLGIPLQNLQGLVIGSYFEAGTQSVLLVSNNAFNPKLETQWLLLRLEQHPQKHAV